MISIHEVSSKMVNITAAYKNYKRLLRNALEVVLQHDETGAWMWASFSADMLEGCTRRYEYKTFRDYLAKWSQFGFEDLQKLFSDDPEILTLLSQADTGKHGGDHGNQYTGGKIRNPNIGTAGVCSETKSYQLRRLSDQRPDLHARVVSGELSANRAAILAGFRKEASILNQLERLWSRASDDERAAFLDKLEYRNRLTQRKAG